MPEPTVEVIKMRDAAMAEVGENGAEAENEETSKTRFGCKWWSSEASKKDKCMTKLLLQHEELLLVDFAKRLNDKEVLLKSTRCIDVQTTTGADGKTEEQTKWIFEALSNGGVIQAKYHLKLNGGLKTVNATLENVTLEDEVAKMTAVELEKVEELDKMEGKNDDGGNNRKKDNKRPKKE